MDALVGALTKNLQYAVSGDKIRYKDGNFDLDLTYITPNIIAMAIPGESMDKAWRNPIQDVSRFLNTMHGTAYRIFNISQETYSAQPFRGSIDTRFGWPDHHAPPLKLLWDLVLEMHRWAAESAQNVIVVHCKAGRSRTGVAICAYLIYAGICLDADSATKLFNSKRSLNENGVVLPSQLRTIASFERIVKEGTHFIDRPKRLLIKEIIIAPVILADDREGGSCLPVTEIQELGTSEPHRIIAKANHPTYWKSDPKMELKLGYVVEGDVQLRISHYTQSLMAFVKSMNRLHNIFVATQTATSTYAYPLVPLLRFSFHTSFIAERGEVKLNLENLDNIFAGPLKSKKYISPNLTVTIVFDEPPGPPIPQGLSGTPATSVPGPALSLIDSPTESFVKRPVLRAEPSHPSLVVSPQAPAVAAHPVPPPRINLPDPESDFYRPAPRVAVGSLSPRRPRGESADSAAAAPFSSNSFTVLGDILKNDPALRPKMQAAPAAPVATPATLQVGNRGSISEPSSSNRRNSVHYQPIAVLSQPQPDLAVPNPTYIPQHENPPMPDRPVFAQMSSVSAPTSPRATAYPELLASPPPPQIYHQQNLNVPSTHLHPAEVDSNYRRSLPPYLMNNFMNQGGYAPPPMQQYQQQQLPRQQPMMVADGYIPLSAQGPAPVPTAAAYPPQCWPPGFAPPPSMSPDPLSVAPPINYNQQQMQPQQYNAYMQPPQVPMMGPSFPMGHESMPPQAYMYK